MSVCACECVCMHECACVCECMCECECVYICECMCVWVWVCACVWVFVWVYVRVCMCVSVHVSVSAHMEVRRQLLGVDSFLLPCGLWWLNSGFHVSLGGECLYCWSILPALEKSFCRICRFTVSWVDNKKYKGWLKSYSKEESSILTGEVVLSPVLHDSIESGTPSRLSSPVRCLQDCVHLHHFLLPTYENAVFEIRADPACFIVTAHIAVRNH